MDYSFKLPLGPYSQNPRVRNATGTLPGELVFADPALPGSDAFDVTHTSVTLSEGSPQESVGCVAWWEHDVYSSELMGLLSQRRYLREKRRNRVAELRRWYRDLLYETEYYTVKRRSLTGYDEHDIVWYEKEWDWHRVRIPLIKYFTKYIYVRQYFSKSRSTHRIRKRTRVKKIIGFKVIREWRYEKVRKVKHIKRAIWHVWHEEHTDWKSIVYHMKNVFPVLYHDDGQYKELTVEIDKINARIGTLRASLKAVPKPCQSITQRSSAGQYSLRPVDRKVGWQVPNWSTLSYVGSPLEPDWAWIRFVPMYGVDPSRAILSDFHESGVKPVLPKKHWFVNRTTVPMQKWDDLGVKIMQGALALINGDVDVADDRAFVGARSILELKDLPATVKQGRDFIRFIRRVPKLRRLAVLGKTLSTAASAYLANKFAIQPTIQDIRSVIKNGWEYLSSLRRGISKIVDQIDPYMSDPGRPVHLRRMIQKRSLQSYHAQIDDAMIPPSVTKVTQLGEYTPLRKRMPAEWLWPDYSGQVAQVPVPFDGRGDVPYFWPTIAAGFDSYDDLERFLKRPLADRQQIAEMRYVDRMVDFCSSYIVTETQVSALLFAHITASDARVKYLHDSWASFLERTRLLSTMWELTPLSFVVDWFATTNSVAKALQNFVGAWTMSLNPSDFTWWCSLNADVFAARQDFEYTEYLTSFLQDPVDSYGSGFRLATVRLTQLCTNKRNDLFQYTGCSKYQRWTPELNPLLAVKPNVKVSLDASKMLTIGAMLTPS